MTSFSNQDNYLSLKETISGELKKANISFVPDRAIYWKESEDRMNHFHVSAPIVADFYIEGWYHKLCIFADEFELHYLSDKQYTCDRQIDRQLGYLGYKVLRFTDLETMRTCRM